MTQTEFRGDAKRVVMLRTLLQTPVMVEAMTLLVQNGPALGVIQPEISTTYAAICLGQVAGFAEFAASLNALATHPDDIASIEAEYIREPE